MTLLASPALAAPEPRELGELPVPLRSDGARFVTWSDGSTVRVIDTRERRSFLVEVPADCVYVAVGGGELLFTCETSPAPEPPHGSRYLPLLYSIERAEYHWPNQVETLLGRQGGSIDVFVSFRDVGRHWIAYEESDGKVSVPYLYEWHTGRSEGRSSLEEGQGRSALDLDEPDALVRMCRPLRRDANPSYRPGYPWDPPYFEYTYVEPFGLGRTSLFDGAGVYLQQCGSRKRRQLAEKTYAHGLTRRVAYWTEGYELHLRVLRSGRRLVYDFSNGRSPDLAGFSIAGTAKRLYVAVSGEDSETATTLPGYVLRTPRR